MTASILSEKVFKEVMKELENIFTVCFSKLDIPEPTLKAYYKYLSCFSDDMFRQIAKRIILKEKRFPAISTFFDYLPIDYSPNGESNRTYL